MLYVNPITGPYRGKVRYCYVCHFGSAPVIALFIKPGSLKDGTVLEAIQRISARRKELEAFVVCLSGPNEELENQLRALAVERQLEIPLSVLPDPGGEETLYAALPIRREAPITMLLYRGKQVVEVVDEAAIFQKLSTEIFGASHQKAGILGAPPGGSNFTDIDDATLLQSSPTFKMLDDAAAALLDGRRN